LIPTYFDETDGMASRECMGNVQPAVSRTADGRLLYPTRNGVAVVDPQRIPATHPVPQIVIEDVIIDNESFRNLAGAKFPSGKRMFEFYFSALHFQAPQKVLYRYKLEGFDEKWTVLKPNENPSAIYFNLAPGAYQFRVSACNNYGQWNEQDTHFSFSISSDFEKSLKVYIPRVLLLLVVALGFYVWRLRKSSPPPIVQKGKKYQTSALTADRAEETLDKLLARMEEDQAYLNPDLTLKKLSESLMIHPNHLSQIINEKLNQSFNDFINKYRIETAKEKLLNPKEDGKTILEIAYDVGFYSKSVFNTAFKKFSGETPSEFRKKRGS
jgi:AraC-like DNA-binding protein